MAVKNIDLNTYQGTLNIKRIVKVWNSEFSGNPYELFPSLCFYNWVQCPQLLSRATVQTFIFMRVVFKILKRETQNIFLDLITGEDINNNMRRYKAEVKSAIMF